MLADQERSYWLAKHIVPNEHLVRAWLARFPDIEADDIIQEGYVVISEADISRVFNPIGYFHTICRNLVLKHYRRAQIVSVTAIADILNDTLADQTPSIEETLDARAELQFLDQIIQNLPETCRNVFICRKINGSPQKQCARELGLSENSVEKQLARALALIAKSYGQRDMPQRKTTGPTRGNRRFS
nr:sigma-70 family RNA polymerase sigma factor [Acetobacter persici]